MIAGKKAFLDMMEAGIAEVLTVSKIEKDKFRFAGWDIEKYEDVIRVSMKDYAESITEIKEIRKADRNERLAKLEMKEYRKFTGKLSWLASGTRSDLSFTVLKMAKKNNSATILDCTI